MLARRIFLFSSFLNILFLFTMTMAIFVRWRVHLFGFYDGRTAVMGHGGMGNGRDRRYDERQNHDEADPFPHVHILQCSP